MTRKRSITTATAAAQDGRGADTASRPRGRPRVFGADETVVRYPIKVPLDERTEVMSRAERLFGGTGRYDYGRGKFSFALWARDALRVAVGMPPGTSVEGEPAELAPSVALGRRTQGEAALVRQALDRLVAAAADASGATAMRLAMREPLEELCRSAVAAVETESAERERALQERLRAAEQVLDDARKRLRG